MKVRRLAGVIALVAALALVLGSCGYVLQTQHITKAREDAGQPALASSSVLDAAAQAHTAAMCTARAVSASPTGAYAQETAVAVHEWVGSAPLDPNTTDANQREIAATNAIWAQWKSDPGFVDSKWDDMGVGEVICGDGNLYMTVVLRQKPTIPATGLYSSAQYSTASVRSFLGIQYTSAVDETGTTIPLHLDVYEPPATAPSPRPAVVLIHGGAFVEGSRTDLAGVSQAWAVRGYTVISPDYRLDADLVNDSSPPKLVAAASQATADVEEAVRWMKLNATTYGIDPNRIAAIGGSAGGAISLGMSAVPDGVPGTGPTAGISSKIAAAISTGAYLTPGIDLGVLHITSGLAPIMMFHYETDAASNTTEYAFRTCSTYRDAGDTCDYVLQPGEGHTTDLSPDSVWWSTEVGPFVWQHLHLGG